MSLARQRALALRRHCRLSVETLHPEFCFVVDREFSVILTVNSGYE